jgi:SAM-dependent methyltransferase
VDSSNNLDIPLATEQVACPLCGNTAGAVVGEKGRFGMAVRNVCCATCATVYVSPRPSEAAMAAYYRSTYRKHYGGVGYVDAAGKHCSPGDAGYEAALLRWHTAQANHALVLGETPRGARVLEIGCRHGKTLQLMRDVRGIEPFGVEPGEAEAEQARHAGIDCFTGSLEELDPGERRFDQVQWFHVLEHVHDPLAALLKLRALLQPNGTLVIEVPNVYQPYGLLEENFFQNVHLVSYSPNTLPALVRRAGFEVTRVVDSGSLFVVAKPRALPAETTLPLPFEPTLLTSPEQDSGWVAQRLQSYALLEKLLTVCKQRGCMPELTAPLVKALAAPAFVGHLADVCAYFVEQLVGRGRIDHALAIVLAVANGPHPDELRREFRSFAERMGAPPEAMARAG